MNHTSYERFSHGSGFEARIHPNGATQRELRKFAAVVATPATVDHTDPNLTLGFWLHDRFVQPAEGFVTGLDGNVVPVEPKAMQVLLCLACAGGGLVSRRELLARFWYADTARDDALTRAVCMLRRTLGDSCRAPRFIQTVHRRGYRLLVPAKSVPSGPQQEAHGSPSDERQRATGEIEAARARPSSLLAELRRRRVFRVASTYAITAWLIAQVGEVTFEPLGVPDWCLTLLVLLLLVGFPLALVLAWAVQLTDRGAVLEMPVAELSAPESGLARTGLRYVLFAALLGVIGLLGFELLASRHELVSAPPGCQSGEVGAAAAAGRHQGSLEQIHLAPARAAAGTLSGSTEGGGASAR